MLAELLDEMVTLVLLELLDRTVEWLLELLDGTMLDEITVLMVEELLEGTVE